MFYLRLLLNVLNFAGNVHFLDITVYIFLCVKETYYITFLTFFAIQEWPDSFVFSVQANAKTHLYNIVTV